MPSAGFEPAISGFTSNEVVLCWLRNPDFKGFNNAWSIYEYTLRCILRNNLYMIYWNINLQSADYDFPKSILHSGMSIRVFFKDRHHIFCSIAV